MLKRFFNKRGQSTFEYAILIAVVVAAIITMHSYMCRAVQARIKTTERELNSVRNQ